MHNVWVGREYRLPGNGVLILAESWYTPEEPLDRSIPDWAAGRVTDALFSRLFNDCSGLRREAATPEQRLAWWHTIAFYNFVPGSIGQTTESRPTQAQFRAAAEPLKEVLKQLAPRAVWIIGKEQSEHSAPVVRGLGIAAVLTNHPRSGVGSAALRSSWASVLSAGRAGPMPAIIATDPVTEPHATPNLFQARVE